MPHLLESFLVCITANGSAEIVGVGFLVAPNHVITCTHVMCTALRIATDTVTSPPGTVDLVFPFLDRTAISAEVVSWSPLESDGRGDITVLQLLDEPPDGCCPAVLMETEDFPKRSFEAYGFPEGNNTGVWAHGTLIGRRTNDTVQLEGTTTTGFAVEYGFSGTPVFDTEAKCVVGMMVSAGRNATVKAAFMLPVSVLIRTWPNLTSQIDSVVESQSGSEIRELLPAPEGNMDLESPLYVERPVDRIAMTSILQPGATIVIKGPRQVGKSSLLIRLVEASKKVGKKCVLLDFQLLDKTTLSDADLFYSQFCSWISHELGMKDRTAEYWEVPLGKSLRCTNFMNDYILQSSDESLVLAIDEVERTFDADFRGDFFSMLRSWHNSRATSSQWKKLDLVLVTSTEPYELINDLYQSPFNVGEVLELEDFNLQQIADLNRRHGSPLTFDEQQLLMDLLQGHPYLVRRTLYLIANRRFSSATLFAEASSDYGPFGDHLRNHLHKLQSRNDLRDGLLQIIDTHHCTDEQIFWRLRGAGLVRRSGRAMLPRCELYANYFGEHLHA